MMESLEKKKKLKRHNETLTEPHLKNLKSTISSKNKKVSNEHSNSKFLMYYFSLHVF